HVSAMSKTFVKDPRDVVKPGDIVKVKVLDVDIPRKRISLTLRLEDEAAPQTGRQGDGGERRQRGGRPPQQRQQGSGRGGRGGGPRQAPPPAKRGRGDAVGGAGLVGPKNGKRGRLRRGPWGCEVVGNWGAGVAGRAVPRAA